ncbi:MAG: hypothetical protein HOQ24_18915 [Mycobacteriaceae bacterium]|nr:hypothetical protein [Mycobacteriaceae bacterium]
MHAIDPDAAIGGPAAVRLDAARAYRRDSLLIIPIALGVALPAAAARRAVTQVTSRPVTPVEAVSS